MDITLVTLNALNTGADDGRKIESGMVCNMINGYFKYKVDRSGSSMYTPRDLNWFERLKYRLKGYKITKLY